MGVVEFLFGLLIIAVIFFFIFDFLDKRKRKKLQKNYDGNEDKSKQGELRKHGKHRSAEYRDGEQNSPDDAELERRRLLQISETNSDGKTDSSTRKTGKSPRGFFARRRRK